MEIVAVQTAAQYLLSETAKTIKPTKTHKKKLYIFNMSFFSVSHMPTIMHLVILYIYVKLSYSSRILTIMANSQISFKTLKIKLCPTIGTP